MNDARFVCPTCRSCGARVLWVETVNGKRMPLDELPNPAGKFLLDESKNPPLAIFAPLGADGARFISHFATCPSAEQHRRPK
jgi:hypothetical protein